MQKSPLQSSPTINYALPIFHSFGHNFNCQRLYNPRRLLGFGLTDGEGSERGWYRLERHTPNLREMTRRNFCDSLTYVSHHGNTVMACSLFKLID